MELKEFIKETLSQLAEGIQEGHDKIISGGGQGVRDSEYMKIEFDIAVTTDEHAKSDAGGKISVASVFSAGGGTEKMMKNINQSRIQFSLLVHVKTQSRDPHHYSFA